MRPYFKTEQAAKHNKDKGSYYFHKSILQYKEIFCIKGNKENLCGQCVILDQILFGEKAEFLSLVCDRDRHKRGTLTMECGLGKNIVWMSVF